MITQSYKDWSSNPTGKPRERGWASQLDALLL